MFLFGIISVLVSNPLIFIVPLQVQNSQNYYLCYYFCSIFGRNFPLRKKSLDWQFSFNILKIPFHCLTCVYPYEKSVISSLILVKVIYVLSSGFSVLYIFPQPLVWNTFTMHAVAKRGYLCFYFIHAYVYSSSWTFSLDYSHHFWNILNIWSPILLLCSIQLSSIIKLHIGTFQCVHMSFGIFYISVFSNFLCLLYIYPFVRCVNSHKCCAILHLF